MSARDDDEDREAILRRRALLVSSLLATMSCSPPPPSVEDGARMSGEPTTTAPASSTAVGTSTQSAAALPPRAPSAPWATLLATAPPREVSPKLSEADAVQRRGALDRLLTVYETLQDLWERSPETCDLTNADCKAKWAEVARKLRTAEDGIPKAFDFGLCGFTPDTTREETLFLTHEHETFLRALVEKVRAELDARVAPSGIMSEQVWLKLVTRPKPGETPMPCLSCMAPPSARLHGPVASFKQNDAGASGGAADTLVAMMRDAPASTVQLRGTADAGETEPDKLALARANAVKKYLVAQGIAANRIQVVGLGAEYPVGSSKTETGRALNRAVWSTPIKVR